MHYNCRRKEGAAMGKSIYSLVLTDEVVAAVDRAAHQSGTSRSNLINQLLAQAFSYVTPEQRVKEIFDEMRAVMAPDGIFQFQAQPSDTMISIRSELPYRYRPMVRYAMELFKEQEGELFGRLRVSVRTKSAPLARALKDFFNLWDQIEKHYLQQFYPARSIPGGVLESQAYLRPLLVPDDPQKQTNSEIAHAAADYIRAFDSCLRVYVSAPDIASGIEQMEQTFIARLSDGRTII